MTVQTDVTDTAVEWLLWVRKLRGMQTRGADVTAELAGLFGPAAKSDTDMPAFLTDLAQRFGAVV